MLLLVGGEVGGEGVAEGAGGEVFFRVFEDVEGVEGEAALLVPVGDGVGEVAEGFVVGGFGDEGDAEAGAAGNEAGGGIGLAEFGAEAGEGLLGAEGGGDVGLGEPCVGEVVAGLGEAAESGGRLRMVERSSGSVFSREREGSLREVPGAEDEAGEEGLVGGVGGVAAEDVEDGSGGEGTGSEGAVVLPVAGFEGAGEPSSRVTQASRAGRSKGPVHSAKRRDWRAMVSRRGIFQGAGGRGQGAGCGSGGAGAAPGEGGRGRVRGGGRCGRRWGWRGPG